MSDLLPGVQIIKSPIYPDDRGEFRQIFDTTLTGALGLDSFVQVNYSSSKKNVFRGFHLQLNPHAQSKLIQCLSGSIIDFVLDPNPTSETFGQIAQIKLDAYSGSAIWVPEQYAHGFLSLEENTRIVYAVSKPWDKESERSISPFSTSLAEIIDLSNVIMSEKDSSAPGLLEVSLEIGKKA